LKDRAVGDDWFKLFDYGYNAPTKRWCTDDIIDNNGLLSVHLPKDLEVAYYLARSGILALHSASDGDPQVYTGCTQIFLTSSGNLGTESTVAIPGHMKYSEPGTNFNIYVNKNAEYRVPGPKVAKASSRRLTKRRDSDPKAASSRTQTGAARKSGPIPKRKTARKLLRSAGLRARYARLLCRRQAVLDASCGRTSARRLTKHAMWGDSMACPMRVKS
jgi:hypothetical protein